jgi:hypothetical protein
MRRLLIGATVVLTCVLLACGARSAAAADTVSPGTTYDELAHAIRNIESAAKVDDAAAAYAQGCTVNRQNVKLQDSYMRRLLKLGRPDLANVPAQELTKLDPKNALCWGTITYVMAKRGPVSFLQALTNGLTAIDLDPENPGICQDVAQLVAWYQAGKRPALDQEAAAVFKKLDDAGFSKEYAKDAKDAQDGYKKLEVDIKARKKEADQAVAEVKKLENTHKQLATQLAAKGKSYDSANQRVDAAKNQLNRSQDDMNRSSDYNQRNTYANNQRTLQQQIRTAQKDADKLLAEGQDMKGQVEAARRAWETKRDQTAKLVKALNSNDELPSSFAWVPPAVNGVITPDTMAGPTRIRVAPAPAADPTKTAALAPDRPAAAPGAAAEPSAAARISEAEAADMLDRARLGVDSKDASMRTMAKNLLSEILKSYPNSKAATEAKALAAKMQ